MRIPLDEAACKVRSGGPNVDEEDMTWPVWAGVLPWTRTHTAPQRHEACTIEPPAYVRDWAGNTTTS